MRALLAAALVSCALSGCIAHARVIDVDVAYETSRQTPLYAQGAESPAPVTQEIDDASTSSSPYVVDPSAAARVLVLTTTHLDRPSEVIGVVDASVPSGEMERAMSELRARAASLHADAVLGVETHAPDVGPIHLSGLAVRFVAARAAY